MTNADILALPDVVRALQCWWDETRSFARGVTSAVIADLLEDAGWDFVEPNWTDIVSWMRGTSDEPAWIDRYHPGPFHEAAGIFSVLNGTTANPTFLRALQWCNRQSGLLWHDWVRGHMLISPEDCVMISHSREIRDYLMGPGGEATIRAWANFLQMDADGLPTLTEAYGFPRRYGMVRFLLSEEQPQGILTMNVDNQLFDVRVY